MITIAESEVAVAVPLAVGEPEDQQRHDHGSAADAEQGAEGTGRDADRRELDQPIAGHGAILERTMCVTYASPSEILDAIEPLAVDPARAAIFFDLDGTLAPIVARPEARELPSRTRELLARIGERYALAGVARGRRAADARRIVGLEQLTYVGNHGFELLVPGSEPRRPGSGAERSRGTWRPRFAPSSIRSGSSGRAAGRGQGRDRGAALAWRRRTSRRRESVAGAIADEAGPRASTPTAAARCSSCGRAVEIDKGDRARRADRRGPDAHRRLLRGRRPHRCRRLQGARTGGRAARACASGLRGGGRRGDPGGGGRRAPTSRLPGPDGFVEVLEALA